MSSACRHWLQHAQYVHRQTRRTNGRRATTQAERTQSPNTQSSASGHMQAGNVPLLQDRPASPARPRAPSQRGSSSAAAARARPRATPRPRPSARTRMDRGPEDDINVALGTPAERSGRGRRRAEARGRGRDGGRHPGRRGRPRRRLAQAEERDLLLLEVAPVLLVDQHQVEVVLDAELVVHRLVRGRQVVRRQEQPGP